MDFVLQCASPLELLVAFSSCTNSFVPSPPLIYKCILHNVAQSDLREQVEHQYEDAATLPVRDDRQAETK